MKITTTALAAMFALLMLIVPIRASADVGSWQPTAVQQIGYVQPVGFWHYRPWACSNHYFRRHHWRMCR